MLNEKQNIETLHTNAQNLIDKFMIISAQAARYPLTKKRDKLFPGM